MSLKRRLERIEDSLPVSEELPSIIFVYPAGEAKSPGFAFVIGDEDPTLQISQQTSETRQEFEARVRQLRLALNDPPRDMVGASRA